MYTGVVAGLIDGRHHKRLGAAWMLFQWCVMRQTGQGINPATGKEEGVVCRGHAVSYAEIAEEMNCARGSVRDWMRRLVEQNYIRTKRDRRGIYVYVLNPKKFRVSKVQHSQQAQSVGIGTHRVSNPQHSKPSDLVGDKAIYENLLRKELTKTLNNNKKAALPFFSTRETRRENPNQPPFLGQMLEAKAMPTPEKPTARELDERRRFLLRQAEQIKAKYAEAH
jgi:DNA-binding IscR family transcriptional regulator